MNVLIINCGSSSVKFQLIHSDNERLLAKGVCERIGLDGKLIYQKTGCEKEEFAEDYLTHKEALESILKILTNKKTGAVANLNMIEAVGHRIVHGGEHFAESEVITDEMIDAVEECSDLAPLHNHANLTGIRICRELMPGIPMVGVFDTVFHHSIPPKAYLYGLPLRYYKDYKIRKYGFHGTSHSFVSQRVMELLNLQKDHSKIIVCHLGNGSSITAVENGRSVDTTMGLTPLEGLIMGTRSGSIDPAIINYIAKKEKLTTAEITSMLNKESGLLGLSEESSDFRDLSLASARGDENASTAIEVLCYDIIKYIGSYAAVMNGVDAIAFTAGIGENASTVRKKVLSHLEYLGIELDEEANNCHGEEKIISTPESKVTVCVIPTNEELAICRDTVRIVKNLRKNAD